MNIDQVSLVIKEEIDWASIFSMITHLGTDLNEMMHRSDKGALIELAIDSFSGGRLRRCNLPGCDHTIPELEDTRIEVKYQRGSLFTKTLNTKTKTSIIPLKNPMGSDKVRTLPHTFDFILLLDDFGVALAPFSVVTQYSKETRDQITAQIPTDELVFLYTPKDFVSTQDTTSYVRFIDMKIHSMTTYISQFDVMLTDTGE